MLNQNNISDIIVYEDDRYLVINKPTMISTLEDRSDPRNILSMFREVYPEITVCHRLDKETSGALLLAKDEEAYRAAALKFEAREVNKIYHALVEGRFTEDTIQVDMGLRVAGSGRVKVDPKRGKEATTLFRAKAYYGNYTLIEAKPISGRRHQIRAHLSYLEYPICGDTYYGGLPIFLSKIKKKYKLSDDKEERPLFDRVALHAYEIEINPFGDKIIKVACDYPKDMDMILKKIEKFG
ncbi:RNA pseudouridine synthase [Reichenbachiella agarivorans]|uniref:RNA pseudouridine synthase n=1 Tax=Reichenbachiella agarivorans TaxID=2979464 RepID=A0ABY6CRB2_9BACT|nr:RNA pseudouridine synthase [Reichenbachiella agarivorans]UXP32575.1 RNA pseudouridine synthase [Reichenbachiella agarivorans]